MKYIGAALVIALAVTLAAQDKKPAPEKIPDEFGVKISQRNLDISRRQTNQLLAQKTYNDDNVGINQDTIEIINLKKQALEASKKDPDKFDVDVDKLVFIEKSATPPTPPASVAPATPAITAPAPTAPVK